MGTGEWGLFNDESADWTSEQAVEAGFWSQEEAEQALKERYTEEDGLVVRQCEDSEEEEPTEPEEGDYTTEDYRKFYQYGKLVVSIPMEDYDADPDCWTKAVKEHMNSQRFWPSVWHCSDHGNWSLLSED